MKTELFVRLVIPDTTAITTFKTLKRMGIDVESVQRCEYYAFESDSDMFNEVSECDILVNVNKHKASKDLKKKDGFAYILVKDVDPADGLKRTLSDRFGFNIQKLIKGVVWEIKGEDSKQIKELLHNPHYQEYVIL